MSTQERSERSTLQAPLSQLERALIDEFVRAQGYDPIKLAELPERERAQILTQASVYASAKLAEVEAKSHLIDEIHE